jgi:hypothetical protein
MRCNPKTPPSPPRNDCAPHRKYWMNKCDRIPACANEWKTWKNLPGVLQRNQNLKDCFLMEQLKFLLL